MAKISLSKKKKEKFSDQESSNTPSSFSFSSLDFSTDQSDEKELIKIGFEEERIIIAEEEFRCFVQRELEGPDSELLTHYLKVIFENEEEIEYRKFRDIFIKKLGDEKDGFRRYFYMRMFERYLQNFLEEL